MPLGLSAATKAALAGGVVRAVSLAEIILPAAQGGPARWTDGRIDVPYDGATWRADGTFVSATLPDAKSERSLRQMRLADPNLVWRTRLAAAGVAGNAVRLIAAVALPTGVLPVITYRGVTDSMAPEFDDEGGLLLVVQCASRFVKLDSQPRVSTSRAFQRALDATDSSMDGAHLARRFVRHKA